AAEFDSRSGPVRDEIAAFIRAWEGTIEQFVREARAAGEIDADADVAQVAFEFAAMLVAANSRLLMTGEVRTLARARAGIDAVLARHSSRAAGRARASRGRARATRRRRD